ncbi:ATPase, AAA-type, core, P-loop containing nucleoside triphosphate hydrolase [Artemisia annua]|nr:ATPase, AAA-type, core, P-loop containing nucleoside triphosphate hydrolase [Artemisia annua]
MTDSDKGVWQRCDLKLQTRFFWMPFFGAIKGVFSAISKLIPTWIHVSFILYVDKLKLRYGSKKKEPINISFDDLTGVDSTLREFQYMITILKGTRVDNRLLPAGIILYGPPGAGKNTFVHALARETNVSFFPVSAFDIKSEDVRIERLFDEARASSPSIVYIRYVDELAKRRDCESSPALVQLLNEMEKCKDNGSIVIVIVAPDYPKNLDPILLDSDMFLDQVHLGYPDEDGRRKIIGLHLKRVLREEDKEAICDIVASQTPGLNWRELRTFAIICTTYAASRGDVYVKMDDVFQALEKINNNVFSNLDKLMAQENMRRRVASIAFGSQK